MSGVTVAQIRRSISDASTPASARASSRCRQCDVGQRLVGRGDPALADARALLNPLVGGVDVCGQVVVRHDLLRHVRAEARDADAAAGSAADHRSTANVSVPRVASASPTYAVALPRPTGPRMALDLARKRQHLAGLDDALEAAVVDPREERDLPTILLFDEHRDGTRLGHGLDDEHAGHDRPRGECPGTTSRRLAPGAWRRPCDRAWLDHLVEQEERVTVRKNPLDFVLADGTAGITRRRRLRAEIACRRGLGRHHTSPSQQAFPTHRRSPETRTRAHP